MLGYESHIETQKGHVHTSQPKHMKPKTHISENNFSLRPLGISETLYAESSDATLLKLLDDCRHPDLNTISHQTLSQLLT
jgi:DNA mismatch repair ATPase MutS